MKTPNWKNCSTEELWKYVAYHFSQEKIDTVLVGGGAVVSIYTEGIYQSGDLDFITSGSLSRSESVLSQLGFKKSGKHYAHPKCKHLFIEFVSGPLGIGSDLDIKPKTKVVNGKKIKILSPTDSIRDRLASYIHFKARECLDQAVLIAKRQTFDMSKVKKWCIREGAKEAFHEFERLLKN